MPIASSVEPAVFTSVMAELSSPVAVLATTDSTGRPVGLTSITVCSLSLQPPLLLVCVSNSSRTLPAIRERGAFAISILRASARHISERFASQLDDKFDGLEWTRTPNGLPVLGKYALATAECTLQGEFVAGDHVILVGAVTYGNRDESGGEPLTYFRRGYRPASVWSG